MAYKYSPIGMKNIVLSQLLKKLPLGKRGKKFEKMHIKDAIAKLLK